MLYQFTHPWHWLTYGQNATAIAAIAACVGLLGLYFYTLYTRAMMESQASTARASITPILVTQGSIEYVPTNMQMVETAPGVMEPRFAHCDATVNVKNIGQGAALYVRAWCQPISANFIAGSNILERTSGAIQSDGLVHLLQSENAAILIQGLPPETLHGRRIIVVETIDSSSLRHQLQIIQTPAGNGRVQTEVNMVHAFPKESRKISRKAAKPKGEQKS